MINNRQAGRRRGRGGQQQRSSGGGGNPGRQDTGNRIDNRARGNAAQLLEKYKTLARDAQMQGDRVNVEYYLQFADHYFRVLAETRARFEENGGAVSTRRIQGATLDEDEPEYEDEGERVEQPQQPQSRNDQSRNDQSRNDQQRGDQQRGDQQRGDQSRNDQQRGGQNGNQQNGYRQEGRQDGNRQDGNRGGYNQNGGQNGQQNAGQPNGNQQATDQRSDSQGYEDRPRGRVNGNGGNATTEGGYERQSEAPRDERVERQPREDRAERQPREERAERQPRGDRYERQDRVARAPERAVEAEPVAIAEELPLEAPVPASVPASLEVAAEAPRRGRGRPRREVAPVIETTSDSGADSAEENGFAGHSLPPMLSVSAVTAPEADNDGELAEKPRRRRGRPPASAANTVD